MERSAEVMGTPLSVPGQRFQILGVPLDNVSMPEALERIEVFLREKVPRQHVSINVHKIVMLQRDPRLREVVEASDLATADGQPVVWAARLLGRPLKGRITGIDLMENLLALAAQKGYRVYFLGAQKEVVARAVDHYRSRYVRLNVAGWADGYWSPAEEPRIVSEIARARPDILFVALNSPRKENFIHEHREQMQVPFAMGVGGVRGQIFDRQVTKSFSSSRYISSEVVVVRWPLSIFKKAKAVIKPPVALISLSFCIMIIYRF